MFSLESDEMTVLWRDDSITFTFYVTFSNAIPHWTIFYSILSLEIDQITAKLSLFCCIFNGIPNWETFEKKVFDSMTSLESDKMTTVCQNDSLTFTFH